MKKTKMTKVLSAILAAAILVSNVGTASAANIQPQNSKDAAVSNEMEPNDASTQATAITVNQQCTGVLSSSSDVDWYKVTTTSAGYIQLKFDIDYTKYYGQLYAGWNFEVYNSQFSKIDSYTSVKNSFTGYILPYKKGTFYIKVSRGTGLGSPVDVPYGLTIQQTKSDTWEMEENNTQQTANTIKLNKQYSGLISSSSDADWYLFSLTKASTVKFDFGRSGNLTIEQVEDIKAGWDMYIYRASDSTQVGYAKHVTTKTDNFTIDLKKGKYYIKICPSATWYCVGKIPYNFKLSTAVTPAKTKIQKTTGSLKAATVKWKKVTGVTGYYVYRSTSKSGTYKKVATVKGASKTSYTNKKLKSNKTYYYKIAAYKTTNGVTSIGTRSAAKSVKTK